MDAITALQSRRSIRTFRKEPVPRELIEKIIDCARLSPTARNEQPWEFVVVTGEKGRRDLAHLTDFGRFIAQAPVCVAVFCRDCKYYIEDGSAATMSVLLAAHALGLAACWVAGDKKTYAKEVGSLLGAPDDMKLVALIPIGYSDEAPQPRKRSLQDVLHWEKF